MATEKVIGIDLGTTNSCVAIVEDGTPSVIPNRGGYKTTPSMVAIAENGKRLVGHIAKRRPRWRYGQLSAHAEERVRMARGLLPNDRLGGVQPITRPAGDPAPNRHAEPDS